MKFTTQHINNQITKLLNTGKVKTKDEEELHLIMNRIRKDGVFMEYIDLSFEALIITYIKK